MLVITLISIKDRHTKTALVSNQCGPFIMVIFIIKDMSCKDILF